MFKKLPQLAFFYWVNIWFQHQMVISPQFLCIDLNSMWVHCVEYLEGFDNFDRPVMSMKNLKIFLGSNSPSARFVVNAFPKNRLDVCYSSTTCLMVSGISHSSGVWSTFSVIMYRSVERGCPTPASLIVTTTYSCPIAMELIINVLMPLSMFKS